MNPRYVLMPKAWPYVGQNDGFEYSSEFQLLNIMDLFVVPKDPHPLQTPGLSHLTSLLWAGKWRNRPLSWTFDSNLT